MQTGTPIAKSFTSRSVLFEVPHIMEIRFISSLTADDENLFAPALLKAVGALLDQLPIAYTVRIETTGAQVFQHTHAGAEDQAKPESGPAFAINAASLARVAFRANGS